MALLQERCSCNLDVGDKSSNIDFLIDLCNQSSLSIKAGMPVTRFMC